MKVKVKVKVKKGTAGRKRRLARWTLVGLGVVLAGMWVASIWSMPRVDVGGVRVAAYRGLIVVAEAPRPPSPPVDWQAEAESHRIPSHLNARQRAHVAWITAEDWWSEMRRFPPGVSWSTSTAPGVGYLVAKQRVFFAVTFAPVVVASVAGIVYLFALARRDRRRQRDHACSGCGYSLVGLAPTAACPECGKAKVAPSS